MVGLVRCSAPPASPAISSTGEESYAKAHPLLLFYAYAGLSSLGHFLSGSPDEFTTRAIVSIFTDALAGTAVLVVTCARCSRCATHPCRNRVAPIIRTEEELMADSVYRVTEVIGVSSESWEAAAKNAVETAAKSVRDLRVAEVVRTDVTIQDGGIASYRVRLAISFKYESGD